jgi:hypothetical protein
MAIKIWFDAHITGMRFINSYSKLERTTYMCRSNREATGKMLFKKPLNHYNNARAIDKSLQRSASKPMQNICWTLCSCCVMHDKGSICSMGSTCSMHTIAVHGSRRTIPFHGTKWPDNEITLTPTEGLLPLNFGIFRGWLP